MRKAKWFFAAWVSAMLTLAGLAWLFGTPELKLTSWQFFGSFAIWMTGVSAVVGCLEVAFRGDEAK